MRKRKRKEARITVIQMIHIKVVNIMKEAKSTVTQIIHIKTVNITQQRNKLIIDVRLCSKL